jgi:Raf kinase inhibitor-like YbhB/YbcL family protein
MDRRNLLEIVGTASVAGLAAVAGCTSGPATDSESPNETETTAATATGSTTATTAATATTTADSFSLTSPAFADGETIPTEYTCSGADVSPPLDIAGVPEAAERLALVVDDPDAPTADPFVHWLLWDVLPGTERIPRDVPQTEVVSILDGARQGTNDAGSVGYAGPCPPGGDGPHTYRFTLSALSEQPDVSPGARREALASEIQRLEIARTRLTGQFQRSENAILR